jgi:NAD(P)-dependent dehydrogenase (short-subunit alcohol dehydrogenase family)
MSQDRRVKRVALVSGANRGIGLEIARQLGATGIRVVIGARDAEKGAEARRLLRDQSIDARWVRLDVTEAHTIQAAVGEIRDICGRLDILVNNAGIMIDAQSSVTELARATLVNTINTNAVGPLLLSQVCVPLMRATLGSLNDMAAPDSPYAAVNCPAYRLSKTLLNGLTVLLARELKADNILVNSACPGWVRTGLGGDRAPLSVQEGADTPVWLATLSDNGPTGG